MEADWGLEETGIQAMEDQEVARTRFLHSDRSRAKVGNIQTTIRIWTETEMFARKRIVDCLDNAQKKAGKNSLRELSDVKKLERNLTKSQMAGSQIQLTMSHTVGNLENLLRGWRKRMEMIMMPNMQ